MSLATATMGVENYIIKINGKDDTKRFLESLGFIEGQTVTVISVLGGNMIVGIKNSRVAINRGMANRIMIEGI